MFGREVLPEFKEPGTSASTEAWPAEQLKGVDAVINSSV